MTNKSKELIIDGKSISEHSPTYFIADIAANHDGDLARAKRLIWLAKEAGADAAKFQHFKAESIVSDFGFKSLGQQKSHQSKWKKSVFDVYKEASVSLDWTLELKKTCKEADITFFTSPYAFDLVDKIDPHVPAYKIGSGDITWIDLIKYIASKGKPYIIASGASTSEDVERAIKAASEINDQVALLQCNTNYTASVENMKFVNLNVLKYYKKIYPNVILGLSDHTPGHATVLGAVALGAKIIEKHFTDDRRREGPDHAFSMDPISWKDMVERTRELEAALGSDFKRIEANEMDTVILQRRAVRVNKNIHEGSKLKMSDVDFLRPCPVDAIPPFNIEKYLNKPLKKTIVKGDYLKEKDFI